MDGCIIPERGGQEIGIYYHTEITQLSLTWKWYDEIELGFRGGLVQSRCRAVAHCRSQALTLVCTAPQHASESCLPYSNAMCVYIF